MCPCHECRTCVIEAQEFFMVEDLIWAQVAPDDPHTMNYFLCVGCLEKRLGRVLMPSDFMDVPGNYVWVRSPRLADRMGGRFA